MITLGNADLSSNSKPKSFLKEVLRFPFLAVLVVVTLSCAAQKKNGKSNYHEDLSTLRIRFPEVVDTVPQTQTRKKGAVIPTWNVNKQVDTILDSINRFNVTRKFIDGYTIQIYSGLNREEAMNAKKKMLADASDLSPELEYNQPKFRVRVGSYLSRLEAQKDMLRLKRPFPNAILVPEKIMVR